LPGLIWLSLSHNSIVVGFAKGARSPGSPRKNRFAGGLLFFNKWRRDELGEMADFKGPRAA
jgi:hypothetical protein